MAMAAAKVRREEQMKEIKQRQLNWMKQRNMAIKTEGKKSQTKSNTQVSKENEKPVSLVRVQQPADHLVTEKPKQKGPSAVEKLNQQTRPKAKFHQWLAAKQNGEDASDLGKGDSETHNDKIYHGRGYHSTVTENGIPDDVSAHQNPDTLSQQHSSNVSDSKNAKLSSLLSADQFDSVADAIVKKVRDELNMKADAKGAITESVSAMPVQNQKYQAFSNSGSSSRESTPVNRNNHSCPDCANIMLGPDHSPMLVIPCGHNLCSMCADQCDLCPTCDCEITGFTQNIMLQQIIGRFHQDQLDPWGPEKYHTDSTRHKHKERYSTLGEETSVLQNTGEEDIDYQDEYQSLCIRCEVLQTESAEIEDHIVSLNHQVELTNKQIGSIEGQQQQLQSQIKAIEEKIGNLQQHKDEYVEQREAVKKRIEKEKAKLHMVQETKKSLAAEAQKMKYLAGID